MYYMLAISTLSSDKTTVYQMHVNMSFTNEKQEYVVILKDHHECIVFKCEFVQLRLCHTHSFAYLI